MSNIIEHKELAISRLATQFKDSVNLINYIRTLLVESDNLEQVFRDLLEKRWVETAEGVQLDILGSIVGQDREVIEGSLFSYFGFSGNILSNTFSSFNDVSIGGRFKAKNESETGLRRLDDNEYRIFIKSKINANITSSTPNEIIEQISYLFNTSQVIFTDGDTEYFVSIGKKLTLNEKILLTDLDVVRKIAGVRVKYTSDYDYDNFFGFNLPNAKGFGNLVDESTTNPFGLGFGLGFGSIEDVSIGGFFSSSGSLSGGAVISGGGNFASLI